MRKPIVKRLFFTSIIDFFISYMIAFRLTDFLMFARIYKAVFFGFLMIIIGLLVFFLIQPLVESLQKGVSGKFQLITLFFSLILAIGLFITFYHLPYFPKALSFVILRGEADTTEQPYGEISIVSIQKVDLPSGNRESINVEHLNTFSSPWYYEKKLIKTREGDNSSGSIMYSRFLQGRIEIEFQTGPSCGTAIIHWNDETLIYNLNDPVEGTKLVRLDPDLSWENADLTRKVLLAGDAISEFFLLASCLYTIGLIPIQIFMIKRVAIRGFGILIAVLVVSAFMLLVNNSLQEEVYFSDPNLENLVREKINNEANPIYQHQLLTIAELDASYQEITDLEGIQALQNLIALDLTGNTVRDVTPLSDLHKLSDLDISANQIVNLLDINFVALSDLKLEHLGLRANLSDERTLIRSGLSDIQILSSFTDLTELDLGENLIEDISALADLSGLSILYLDFNNITDITPLADLHSLTYLNLSNNHISDISSLQNHLQLTYLNLNSNIEITDLSPISNLSDLEALILNNIHVGDSISLIRDMQRLTRLEVDNCGITDLSDLGYLMAEGSLQDDPDRRIAAEVSIRDNPLDILQGDDFAPIRNYWLNITTRDPVALPAINTLAEPVFSHQGGFYTEAFELTIQSEDPDVVILYTLDGSEPDIEHVSNSAYPYQQTYIYAEKLTIESRQGDPNVFSMFNTADLVNEWLPLWVQPEGEVYKTNVIRAIAFDESTGESSGIVTYTYFVDEDIFERYATLPIISLTSDYQYLFDPETGIYTSGTPTGLPSPSISFNESVVPATIEFYEQDGSLGFSGVYEIELQGNTSRASPQKGLMVTANSWVGDDFINYPIFSASESDANQIPIFKNFIIRGWGSARNWPIFFSDAYSQTLMAKADQDIQDYRPVIVFINGEYWGLHELREANRNSWYHQFHTGVDAADPGFDLLDKGYNQVDEGSSEDWDVLMEFIATHDLSVTENYQYVESKVDIDNFINYVIHCIYTGKKDWPSHNESKWRVRSDDGKWRWVQYDMDHGMNHDGRPEYDMVYHTAFDETHYHPLLVALLANQEFKYKFLDYFADDLNTYFLPVVENNHFEKMVAELAPYIPEFEARWPIGYDWEEGLSYGRDLICRRYNMRWKQVISNFELLGISQITLQTDPNMGLIRINSILISSDTPGVVDPAIWTGTYFIGIPVEIEAIPEPGCHFIAWEGVDEGLSDSSLITILPNEGTTLTAIFEEDSD
jgi:hypothetical protein